MTFAQIPPGAAIFLDANTLIYHFTSEPTYGSACTLGPSGELVR
jgi:hypothetical protein